MRISTTAFLLSFLLLFNFVVDAQTGKQITGVIKDDKGDPLIGATVQEVGQISNSTSSDSLGKFSITLKGNSGKLLFTYAGYEKQEVDANASLSITLLPSIKDESDIVIVGYQSIQRKKSTAAIGSVKGKEIENTPYVSFDQMLQGRVAGLTVLSTSGEPGANNIVNVRGSTSLTSGGVSAPLYVIDGIVFDVGDMMSTYGNSNPLTAINPNDIESIDVLKDASASAIYGARAANGVIMVKTKQAQAGKPQFKVSAYAGISDRPALKPVIAGVAERQLKMQLLRAGGDYTRIRDGALNLFLTDSLNDAFNNNTDWQGMFLRQASLRNVDASVAGRDDKYSYRVSINSYNEEGVMKGYSVSRLAPRLFLQLRPAKGVEITNNLFMSFTKSEHGTGDGVRYPFTAWGFPSSFWSLNDNDIQAYTGRLDNNRDDDRGTSVNGNTKVQVDLLPGLFVSSTIDYMYTVGRRDRYVSGVLNANGLSSASNTSNISRRWELTNMLTYFKAFGNHNFSAILGQGSEQQVNQSTNLSATGIPIDAIKTIIGVPSANLNGSSTVQERSRLSWFGRISYDYKGKYMIDLNYRRDASSRYGKDNRWGSFPAISGAWNIAEENFMEPIKHAFSFFKIRGSYGITGLDPGGYYAQYQQLGNSASYYGSRAGLANGSMTTYNGVVVTYPNYGSPAAARSITWEKSPQYNIGVDLGFVKDRFTLTAEYYTRDSKDKIFDVAVPVETGYTLVSSNFVSLRNTGVEFTLGVEIFPRTSQFQWRSNFNIAYNKNYVTKLPDGGRDFYYGAPWMRRSLSIGRPLFSFEVWNVNGVYANTSDVPVDPLTGQRMRWGSATGTFFGAGDPVRVDMNGDYIINDLDRVTMGNPNPDVIGGWNNTFTYKGFSLDVLCTFITGRSLWNGYLSDRLQDAGTPDPYYIWGGSSGPAMDFGGATFWQAAGDIAQYPSLITNSVDKWHIAQSMYVEDASFFRMKRVSLGYMIPQAVTKKFKLGQVRFYGMLDNVFVLSRATVPDPEAVGADGYSSGNDYPLPKKITFGIDINF